MKKKLTFVIPSIFFILIVFYFFSTNNTSTSDSTKIKRTQYQDTNVSTGSISARDDIKLSFEKSGLINNVNFEAGSRVSRGAIIANLDSREVLADIQAQKSEVEQAAARVSSNNNTEENVDDVKIEANRLRSEQKLQGETLISLVNAQKTAVDLESFVRTRIDPSFDNVSVSPDFNLPISAQDKIKINRSRQDLEVIFDRWRGWNLISDAGYSDVVLILKTLDSDLRKMNFAITNIHDTFIKHRNSNSDNEVVYLEISNLRNTVLDSIVNTLEDLSNLQLANRDHVVVLAETKENRVVLEETLNIEREKLRKLEIEYERTFITAPFDGIIGEVFVGEGDFVGVGDVAVRLISEESFELNINVTEIDIDNIEVDQKVRAVITATDDELSVNVRAINATETNQSGVPVYSVMLDIDNEDISKVRPGFSVDVYIPSSEARDVLIVKRDAIFKRGDANFIKDKKTDEFIPVTLGSLIDEDVIIEGEVNDGQEVYLNNTF